MNAWANFIGYQLAWFAVVDGAAHGFHAMRFLPPSYRAAVGLAAGWAIAITLLFHWIRRSAGNAAAASPARAAVPAQAADTSARPSARSS